MQQEIQQYIQDLQWTNRSAATIRQYKTALAVACEYLHGRGVEHWSQVTRADCIALCAYWADVRMVAKSSQQTYRAILRAFFAYLTTQQLLTTSPWIHVESMRVHTPAAGYLSHRQIAAILEETTAHRDPWIGSRDQIAIELMYCGGLRAAEAANLCWRHVHAHDQIIEVMGKGGRQRVAILPKQTMNLLTDWREQSHTQTVLCTTQGKRMTASRIWSRVQVYALRAGVLECTPHVLRHSFATHMVHNGADIRTVQRLLGHASLAHTHRYTHTVGLRDMLEKYHPRNQDG